MAGNTIDAKLRIAAQVAEAISNLRALRREILETGSAGQKAAATGPGQAAVAEARATRQAQTQEETAAARAATAAAREAAVTRRAAARADAEDLKKQRAEQRKANADRTREEQEVARQVAAAANIQKQAYRQLPAQITDVVTSLISGQPAYMVAIQQGGQVKDSFGGMGAAAKALAAVLTPVRLAVGGVAAVVGSLAVAAGLGYYETDKLNKALALTGNVAGTSIGQIGTLATGIAADTRSSIGSVRETLLLLVQAGSESGTTLSSTARAVTAFRKLTGASAEEGVKIFAGQRDAVLDWATKANKAYNFLTAAQLAQIRTLQAQGRSDEAVRLANDELAATLTQRTAPAIGFLETVWNKVSKAASDAWDAMKGVGRGRTVDDDIAFLRQRVKDLEDLEKTLAAVQKRPVEESGPLAKARAELAALENLTNRDRARVAERSAQQLVEQDKALKASKAYTDAEQAVKLAGFQKTLTAQLAALDAEQAAVESNRAKQVITETERVEQLNAIDQQRLVAQRKFLREQIQLANAATTESPLDESNKKATVAQLEGQLLALESRIQTAATEGQTKITALAVEQAAQWKAAWEGVARDVAQYADENAGRAGKLLSDPAGRAKAAGDLAAAQAKRDLDEQLKSGRAEAKRLLDETGNLVQFNSMQALLDRLSNEGGAVVAERGREAAFSSLRQQFDTLTQTLAQGEQDLNDAVDRGALGTEEAEQRKLAARAQSVPQLQLILELLRQLATTDVETNQVAGAQAATAAWGDFRTELEKTARSSAVNELAGGLTDVETGAKTAGEALRDMVSGFARALLNVLNQRLAQKLVDSFLKAIDGLGSGSSTNPYATTIATVGSQIVKLFHTGGVIGQTAGGLSRAIAPAAFTAAQVLHGGGLVGLKSNERPVIAEVGEEMLTADNPRHINNFRGGGLSVQSSYTFNGSGGTDAEQRQAANELDRRMRATVQQWAQEQSRQGGLFSGGRRG